MSNSSSNSTTSSAFAQLLAEHEAKQQLRGNSRLVHGIYQGNGLVDLGEKFDGAIVPAELDELDLVVGQSYPFLKVGSGCEAEDGEKDGKLDQLSHLKGRTLAQAQAALDAGKPLQVKIGHLARSGGRNDWAKKSKVAGVSVSIGEGLGRINGFMPWSAMVPAWCDDSTRETAIRSFSEKNPRFAAKVLSVNVSTEKRETALLVGLPNAMVKDDPKRRPTVADIQLNQTYTGVVCNIMPFGVFVDIGGIQGLVHVSEIPGQTTDGIKSGDFVEVTAIKFVGDKAGFSLNRPLQTRMLERLNLGDSIEGTVRNTVRFDRFVNLDESLRLDAILRGRDCPLAFKAEIGTRIRARISTIDAKAGRISLTQPQVVAPAAAAAVAA